MNWILYATTVVCLCFSLINVSRSQNVNSDEKWSRQLENSGPGEADSFDWVPVAQPVDGVKDRSSNARVLTYSQAFPPNGKIGDLPKHQHSHLGFPYQFQRFPSHPLQQHHAPQAGPLRHHSKANDLPLQQPTSQSFFKFEMPSYHSDGSRQEGGPPLQTGYQIHHSFSGGGGGGGSGSSQQAALFAPPLFSQKPVFPSEFHPSAILPHRSQNHPVAQKQIQQNFIEDIQSSGKNQFREVKPLPTSEALATVAPQTFPVQQEPEELRPTFELQRPTSFQSQLPFHATSPQEHIQNSPEQQEVQLVYVPYDTLYNQDQSHLNQSPTPSNNPSANQIYEPNRYNNAPPQSIPVVNPYQVNSFYTPDSVSDLQAYTTSTTHRPSTKTISTSTTSTTLKPSRPYQSFENAQFSSIKQKPKPHQPPLAMFLHRNSQRPSQMDVVQALRSSHSISVLDAPTKQTPNIFIGPAGMPTPNGFAKFELPYLSQIDQSRNLHDVPFFVAPLSYRTPGGFNKILLPEPHVGSIVINKGLDDYTRSNQHSSIVQQVDPNSVYVTPSQNEIIQKQQQQQQQQSTTAHGRPIATTLHVKGNSGMSLTKDYYPELIREVLNVHQQKFSDQGRNQYATSAPSRGHKWHEINSQSTKNYYQEPIQEISPPKVAQKQKQRPYYQQQTADNNGYSLNSRPYANFKPMPNTIVNEDYFKVQPIKTTSTSVTPATSQTSTSPQPPQYYTQSYQTSPQVEFHSTSGQLYPEISSQNSQATTMPSSSQSQSNANDEEYRMKQYFRQQDAFRKRPQTSTTTTATSSYPFESVRYNPVSVDYEVKIPSSTSPYYTTPSTTRSSPSPKQRITFYSPAPTTTTTNAPETDFNTVPPNDYQNQPQVIEFSRDSDTQTQTEVVIGQGPEKNNHPSNHRPTYSSNNEVEFEPNPYQLPSELPPLAPNLPGLVNSLQEKDKQNIIGNQGGVASHQSDNEGQSRPLNRSRKPPVVSKVSSSVSYSTSETSTRRPFNRVRRPYGTRNHSTSSTTTARPASSRKPIIRNPNRIRYNPTPEERQSLRIKTRKHHSNNGSSKKTSESEDLDYQRDVLKQNYPVIKPSSKKSDGSSSSPTSASGAAYSTTDRPGSESQQIYTVTPNSLSASGDTGYPGLLEPMQIAQHYKKHPKDNFGPGYFPKEEDINPTESITRNEINPVYTTAPTSTIITTTTTTTEEPPPATTRRTPFIRRGPRIRTTTTTEPPTAATAASEERHTIRPRIPPRKIIKVRSRTRKPPHPASTTEIPNDNNESESETAQQISGKGNYRKLHRFNQDLYHDEQAQRRVRPNSQFHLDGQESQWSPSLSSKGNNNNFKPLNLKDRIITAELKFAKEPEIVTANPNENDPNRSETYEFNVSAGFEPTANSFNTPTSNDTRSEKSFDELVEEVMGSDAAENAKAEDEIDKKTSDGTFFESQKTDITNRLIRRGKWKKVRVHPVESFEAAESQNIGSQLYNSLYNSGSIEKSTETPIDTATAAAATTAKSFDDPATTEYFEDFMDYDQTTKIPETTTTQNLLDDFPFESKNNKSSESEESATRRNDNGNVENIEDLDGQSSLFSEVRKQLSDLFAIEEDDETLAAATASNHKIRHEYTNIQRIRTEPTPMTQTTPTITALPTTESTPMEQNKTTFHKDLMNSVVYATSTSTKVSSETEICYRGRCIRSEDLPPNHKLH